MEMFDIIKKLCDEQNVKITVLERDLGFSRGAIYKMAESAPSSDKLKKLADYFNVSADYLLERTDSQQGFVYSNSNMTYDMFVRMYTNSKGSLSSEEKIKLAQKILSDIND